MDELDDLLTAAREAAREDRIQYRDRLAAFGADVIPPMQAWLVEPEFGAFAVRVLEKVGAHGEVRQAAIDALRSADATEIAEPVARDVIDTIARLSPGRTGSPTQGTTARLQWAGYSHAQPLEQRFHDAMLDIFRLAGEATRKIRPDGSVERGYWASYFLRGVRNHGGLAYARALLDANGTTDGFQRLAEEGRLDLTMEALILRAEFSPLFSERERQVASSRLAKAGFDPNL